MRIRILFRGKDKVQLLADQQSGKGKKTTSGLVVPRGQLRKECTRLVRQCRGEKDE